MKRFKFRFEAVEKVRKSHEQTAQRIFAEAQRIYQEGIDHKVSLQNLLNKTLISREDLSKNEISSQAFVLETEFIEGTKIRMIQADQVILRSRKRLEKAMRAMVLARKSVNTLEILKEKDFDLYKKIKRKDAERELDDLFVMRSGRAANESENQEQEEMNGEIK